MVRALKGLEERRPATVGSLGRRFASVGVLIALAGALSCSDLLGPADVAGTYALRTLRGASLPTPLREDRSDPTLIADTLDLRSDGSGVWIDVYEYAPTGGATAPDTARFEMNVRIAERNGQLFLEEQFTCLPGANCRLPDSYPLVRYAGELVLNAGGARFYTRQAP